ncbi:hypothetical protein Tco_0522649 [Tanacetum coccineum]
MESQFQSLKEEMHEMHTNYNNRGGNQASKNDDTPMCERHEENYIQSEGNQNRNSHDLFSRQSHHDPNDSEKSLTDLNNDVKNDLEDFKRCVCSMRTVHSKLYERDDQSKTDLEKTITKFLDGQGVANICSWEILLKSPYFALEVGICDNCALSSYVSLIRKKFYWGTIFLIGLKCYRDPKEEPIEKEPLMELKEIG